MEIRSHVYRGLERPTPGFFAELDHLLRGITGRAGIYDKTFMAFTKHKGRKAARMRSADLSRMYRKAQGFMERYPCGLDDEVVRRRSKNKQRILQYFGATELEWEDWHWLTLTCTLTYPSTGTSSACGMGARTFPNIALSGITTNEPWGGEGRSSSPLPLNLCDEGFSSSLRPGKIPRRCSPSMEYDRPSLVLGRILLDSLQTKSMIGQWDGMVASTIFLVGYSGRHEPPHL